MLLRINDYEVTRSQFEEIYRKNNVDHVIAEPKSIGEYLQVYIDFRLKVEEAKRLGLHNDPDFVRELAGYREQLANQYLVDREVTNQLVEEAFERSLFDIRASHILLSLGEFALPGDTLAAYETALEIRERAMQGEPFSELARKYSDEASARDHDGPENHPMRPGHAGDMGYFTVFNMVYPFESAAYNTPVGEVSMPVRTSFGYHIIKVTDRLPAMGTARIAHIMLMTPPGTDPADIELKEKQIHEIYDQLNEGADFGQLALRFSDDTPTARRNGEMNPFVTNRMVPEFIKAISKLNHKGDVSPPVRTAYGWHIIRLLEKTLPPDFDQAFSNIQEKVRRDARSQLGEQAVIDRLKREYAYEENPAALKPFYSILDETVFQGDWDVSNAVHLHDELVRFSGKAYTQQDFARFLHDNQTRQNPTELIAYVNAAFARFSTERLLAYERSVLEEKYPAFKQIMKEYHDGILLFEVTDREVWSRAIEDTLGLQEYFSMHAANYRWDDRVEAILFSTSSSDVAASVAELLHGAGEDPDLVSIADQFTEGSLPLVTMRKGVFGSNDLPPTFDDSFRLGLHGPMKENGQFQILLVQNLMPSRQMELSEVKGMVISDYQQYLEDHWVNTLRESYHVQIDHEVLNHLKQEWK